MSERCVYVVTNFYRTTVKVKWMKLVCDDNGYILWFIQYNTNIHNVYTFIALKERKKTKKKIRTHTGHIANFYFYKYEQFIWCHNNNIVCIWLFFCFVSSLWYFIFFLRSAHFLCSFGGIVYTFFLHSFITWFNINRVLHAFVIKCGVIFVDTASFYWYIVTFTFFLWEKSVNHMVCTSFFFYFKYSMNQDVLLFHKMTKPSVS